MQSLPQIQYKGFADGKLKIQKVSLKKTSKTIS